MLWAVVMHLDVVTMKESLGGCVAVVQACSLVNKLVDLVVNDCSLLAATFALNVLAVMKE